MYPIDALSNIDKTTIASYISIYGNAECAPINLILHEWNKNKVKLFKAFGQKLRISKQISIPKDTTIIASELDAIYHPYIFWHEADVQDFINYPDNVSTFVNNDFIQDVLFFWAKKDYCIQDLYTLSRLFLHKNLVKGYICSLENDEPYHFKDFKCTIKNSMKTIRTIQKVLKEALDLDSTQTLQGYYDDAERALDEAKSAIDKILAGAENIELQPQNQQIRKLQHELVEQHNLISKSVGEGADRHLRIVGGQDYNK